MPDPIERCPVCNWPMAASLAEGCVPGNCSQRPAPRVAAALRGFSGLSDNEIERLRHEVESLKAALVLAQAQQTHCPNCDCFDEEVEEETIEQAIADEIAIIRGSANRCSQCSEFIGMPHWPRCTRRGIVSASDVQDGPHAL